MWAFGCVLVHMGSGHTPYSHLKHLKEAKDYAFIAPGAVEVDTEGQKYSERFRASDIDWFKRVIASFRTSLGYTKDDTDQKISFEGAGVTGRDLGTQRGGAE